MSQIEQRLTQLGLELPQPAKPPPGFKLSFSWVRVSGNRAYLSGHGALAVDGRPFGPFGKVPTEVSMDEAQQSARGAVVSMLASLKRVG